MKTSVNWPGELLQRVKALADRNGFCVACVVELLVEDALFKLNKADTPASDTRTQ